MKKYALLLLLVLGALTLMVGSASAKPRNNPILPPVNPMPRPLVSAN